LAVLISITSPAALTAGSSFFVLTPRDLECRQPILRQEVKKLPLLILTILIAAGERAPDIGIAARNAADAGAWSFSRYGSE
jgi:hypothetical protein